MRHTRVARRYARALMSVAEEKNAMERFAEDLKLVEGVIRDSRGFRLMLASPVVSMARKKAVLRDLFGKRVAPDTAAFLDLLVEKHRESILPEIVEEFNALRDAKLGIVNVSVASAIELTAAQQKALQAQLEQHTRRTVRLQLTVDREIKGGLVVRIGDTVLDASVRRQLERLREQFVSAPVAH